MSNKRKDTPRTPIEWFMNNLLFTQRFEFETSLDIHTVMERLQESAQKPKSWRHPRFALSSERHKGRYQFYLDAKDDRGQYTIIRATGLVDSSEQDGARVIGEVRFGVVYFFLLGLSVLWMVFIFQFFGLRIPPWMLALVMAGPLLTFGHMFWKRHYVLKDIKASITPRMSDRKFEKLKRQDTDDDTYTLMDDDESQQYGRQ